MIIVPAVCLTRACPRSCRSQMVTGALLQAPPPASFTLEESADRILSGTNSHVEVQFITPVRNDRIAQGEDGHGAAKQL